jgi:hypothetical protein
MRKKKNYLKLGKKNVLCLICERPIEVDGQNGPVELQRKKRKDGGYQRRFVHAFCHTLSWGEIRRGRAVKIPVREMLGEY